MQSGHKIQFPEIDCKSRGGDTQASSPLVTFKLAKKEKRENQGVGHFATEKTKRCKTHVEHGLHLSQASEEKSDPTTVPNLICHADLAGGKCGKT